MSWLCPLCHQPLAAQNNAYRCPQGHTFDRAKEGYVNLLPVQHKRSKEPGDSAEMIQARRRFLNAGHYQPLRDAIAQQLDARLSEQPGDVLDIGCGEGYYTDAFSQIARQYQHVCYGLDVSRPAIRAGAKCYRHIEFCVASSHRLPFADSSFAAIIRIYAPCKADELFRVVKENGLVITATPAPRHLVQFKGLIYPQVKLHNAEPEVLEGFTLEQELRLNYPMNLRGEEAMALLQMTPFAWRAKPEVWQQLAESERFECETDFFIRIWRKTAV